MINDTNCFFPNRIFHPAVKELNALFFSRLFGWSIIYFKGSDDLPGIFSASWAPSDQKILQSEI